MSSPPCKLRGNELYCSTNDLIAEEDLQTTSELIELSDADLLEDEAFSTSEQIASSGTSRARGQQGDASITHQTGPGANAMAYDGTIDPRLLSIDEVARQSQSAIPNEQQGAPVAAAMPDDNEDEGKGNNNRATIPRYSCPVEGCAGKFRYPKDLSRHVTTHLGDSARVFQCPDPNCLHATKGFSRQDTLTRHIKAKHPEFA